MQKAMQVAQAIMIGLLMPEDACRELQTEPLVIVLPPAEPGWHDFNFSFQIIQNHIYVVVNYAHDDSIDRGIAFAKMRATMRNLVNWLLLAQSIMTSANMTLESDEVVVRYEPENVWVALVEPKSELTEQRPRASNEAVSLGVSWLAFLLADRRLLYALQDYSASLNYPEFCLFFLWRAVEWILWEFEERTDVNNPAFASAAEALGLSVAWFEEIGRLAHTYTRHARLREMPEPSLVDTARERVRNLIRRYINIKHQNARPPEGELPIDHLTGWQPPERH